MDDGKDEFSPFKMGWREVMVEFSDAHAWLCSVETVDLLSKEKAIFGGAGCFCGSICQQKTRHIKNNYALSE
ncbi:hypothetical protein PT282_07405 [Bifidobacterium sp. ESL0763]|uniref:hypothetical protein n=1 Tax=Bifidobacterium sp. ESL0763 TaxID=2983227 RepID=UPI0023F9D9F2|nr:hypothetical protein [Bifidobacterium sp. ESL0763]MDF7664480.1 hypothetical protein [Bifidobacterium sp. ESL0763]